jgi:uncharacterized protein (TIGR03000 family)
VSDADVWGANYLYSASTPFVPIRATPPAVNTPVKTTSMAPASGSARLVIEMPADAKLYIDDNPVKSTAELRQFYTPTLEANQTYFYDVRVEMIKDNKLVTENKRVFVRANDVVRESFKTTKSIEAVASK